MSQERTIEELRRTIKDQRRHIGSLNKKLAAAEAEIKRLKAGENE